MKISIKYINFLSLSVAIFASICFYSSFSWAETTPKDMQVLGRALGFLEKPLTGSVVVGVVYAPGNSASEADLKAVQDTLAKGLKSGNVTLEAKAIPITALGSEINDLKVIFVTEGLSSQYEQIVAAIKDKGILSVTTDLGCVQAEKCAVGVKSEPKVEIIVSRAAAGAVGVAFSASFRMMIKEI
jgi:hypothetical protein